MKFVLYWKDKKQQQIKKNIRSVFWIILQLYNLSNKMADVRHI